MIMNNENEGDIGESSKDLGHLEDKQRPFKKARYEWELKGKHHLKEKNNNNSQILTIEVNDNESNKENHIQEYIENDNNKVTNEISRKSFEITCQNPLHLSEHFDEIDSNIPISLVPPNLREPEEFYLLKWQTRQMAKSFMDNTINRVLETCNLNIDAVDLNEDYEDDGQVEDEGILMAIQHHGLHSQLTINNPLNTVTDTDNFNCLNSNKKIKPSNTVPESTLDNYENFHNELLKNHSNENMICDESIDCGIINFDFMGAAVSAAIEKKGLSYE